MCQGSLNMSSNIYEKITCKAEGQIHVTFWAGWLEWYEFRRIDAPISWLDVVIDVGHNDAADGPDRPYWANWMEIVVPLGQFNVTCSASQPARWNVRNVPDINAERKEDIYEYNHILLWTKPFKTEKHKYLLEIYSFVTFTI